MNIISNEQPNALVPFRVEKGFSKALVCHNAPTDGDIVGTVSWTKQTGSANSSAVESVVNYDGSNCFLIEGLTPIVAYSSSIAFVDEFSVANPAILTSQYQTTNNILGSIYLIDFSTATPTTIVSTTKLSTLTKDGGSLTVRLDMLNYATSTNLLVEVSSGGAWDTAYYGVSSEVVDIQVPVGTYQIRVKSVVVFSDGTTDTSSAQVYGGADVVVDAVLDAASGLSARTLIVSANAQTFSYDSAGAAIGTSPATDIVLEAKIQNITEGTTVWATNPTDIGTDNLDGTYTVTQADFGILTSLEVTANRNDLSDTTRLVRLQNGADGTGTSPITMVLSNSNHTLPADVTGTVTSLSDSGTQIHVYEGIDVLVYDGVGTDPGTWKLNTPSTSNVTIGSITDQGAYAQVANLVGMGVGIPTGSITYTASGTTVGGDPFTSAPRVQSFSKAIAGIPGDAGAAAKSLITTSTGQTFSYDASGGHFGNPNVVITANLQNLTGTASWGSSASGSFAGGTISGNTYTVTAAQFGTNDYVTITATLGSFSDSITIARLQDGAIGEDGISAVSAILSNSAHTIPSDSDGVVADLTGSGTEIRVYEGTTLLAYDSTPAAGQWKATPTASNVTAATSLTDSGTYGTMPDITDMGAADTGSITYTISGNRLDGVAFSNITLVQSFSKTKQGVSVEGARGATNLSIVVGSAAWSDASADSITPGDNIIGDRVTQTFGTSFIETRAWNGVAWVLLDQVLDGNILFPGSIITSALSAQAVTAAKINVTDLFSTSITASGSITYQNNGNSAVLGGGSLITASDSSGVVFEIGENGGGILNSSILVGEVPGGVIGQEALDVIQSFLGTTTPATGGKSSSSFSVSTVNRTVILDGFNHGTNTPKVKFSGDTSIFSEGAQIADKVINVQIFRSEDAGANVSIYNTNISAVETVLGGGNYRYVWNPTFEINDSAATFNTIVRYTVVLTGISTDLMPINCSFSAEEVAVGAAGTTYTLPEATDSILGGVIVGTGLTITNGVLDADAASGGDADTLGTQIPAYYLDYGNFTGTPSIPTLSTSVTSTSTTTAATSSAVRTAYNRSWPNTTYSAGTGMSLSGTTFNCTVVNTNTTYSAGTGMSVTGTTFRVNYGTSSTTACAGNDSRLSNARTPTTHTHSQYADKTSGGTQAFSGVITAPNVTGTSDINVKYNIDYITNALYKAAFIGGYEFNRKDMGGVRHAGVLAQIVDMVLPEAIDVNGDGHLSVSIPATVGLLFAAFTETEERLVECERLIKELTK
jgi:hypothetical protein